MVTAVSCEAKSAIGIFILSTAHRDETEIFDTVFVATICAKLSTILWTRDPVISNKSKIVRFCWWEELSTDFWGAGFFTYAIAATIARDYKLVRCCINDGVNKFTIQNNQISNVGVSGCIRHSNKRSNITLAESLCLIMDYWHGAPLS